MKRIIKLGSLVLCVLLTLTACSAVFDSAISGTIKDRSVKETSSTSTGGIADVMVYAYDNESTWNSRYSSWTGESEFVDNTVPSAKTAADGSFSISNLRWITTSPEYGKDADSKTIYLLAFHKDYGLVKVDGRKIQSDKSNNFGIVYMDKATVTKTLVVKLKDIDDNSTSSVTGSDSTITDTTGFSFQYRYCDGYSTEDNVSGKVDSFTNGQATITVKYKEYKAKSTEKADVPKVTLYNIETGSDWTLTTELVENEYVISYDSEKKDFKNSDLSFSNAWKSVSVSVDLIDGSSYNQASITDPIYFKWSYENGDGETKSGNVTPTTGSTTISVKFKKDMTSPKLVLEAFKYDDKDNDDRWTWTKGESNSTEMTDGAKIEVALSTDKDTVTQKVYFRRNYITLDTGISGYLISNTPEKSGETNPNGYGFSCDDNDKIYLCDASGNVLADVNPVTTRKEKIQSTDTICYNYGHFTGLGTDKSFKLKLTYSGTSYVGTTEEYTFKYLPNGTKYSTVNLKDPTESSKSIQFNSKTTDFSVMIYKN